MISITKISPEGNISIPKSTIEQKKGESMLKIVYNNKGKTCKTIKLAIANEFRNPL